MNDSLFREVEEDVRRERMQRLWKQYRLPLAIAVVALVLGTAGSDMWREHQAKKAGIAMQKLDAALTLLQQGDAAGAIRDLSALAEQSGGELKDIARLWQGRAELENKQAEAAVKSWTDLAANPAGSDLIWRDLACLRLQAANADAPAACSGTAASPLKSQRLEWQAALLWQQGKTEEARALLTPLAEDADAPQSQRDRVRRLLRALGAEAK